MSTPTDDGLLPPVSPELPPASPAASVPEVKVRVRRVPTTPAVLALLEQCDQEVERATTQMRTVLAAVLASHGVTDPARITETVEAKGTRGPQLVIEVRTTKGTRT